jgi:serine/threonine protein kinase
MTRGARAGQHHVRLDGAGRTRRVKRLQGSVKKLQGSVKRLQGSVKRLQGSVKRLQGSVKRRCASCEAHRQCETRHALKGARRQVRLTDFGLSRKLGEAAAGRDSVPPPPPPSGTKWTRRVPHPVLIGHVASLSQVQLSLVGGGTAWYLPPECFPAPGARHETPPVVTPKVDVWSAGVVLFEMLFGRRPFAEGMNQERFWREAPALFREPLAVPDEPPVSPEARAFLRRCLTPAPAARPSVADLLRDPFLAGAVGARPPAPPRAPTAPRPPSTPSAPTPPPPGQAG